VATLACGGRYDVGTTDGHAAGGKSSAPGSMLPGAAWPAAQVRARPLQA